MSREFTIDISPDGKQVVIEGHGFEGPECKEFSKAIEEGIGDVESVVKKPEFDRKVPVGRGRMVRS